MTDLELNQQELWEKDRAFPLEEIDHIWPKTSNNYQMCKCPRHGDGTYNLFYACYKRILKAQQGIKPRSIASQIRELREGKVQTGGRW